MFDIGFSEFIVIGLVALIVIGPERLPRVARTAGALLGRFQRYVNDVKSEPASGEAPAAAAGWVGEALPEQTPAAEAVEDPDTTGKAV